MRLIEMRDESLLKQPDISYLGCPICCLPLSVDLEKSTMMSCCCKVICNGCDHANAKSEVEQGLEHRCAFCREPEAKSKEESNKRIMERVKKGDPVAMTAIGKKHYHEGDDGKALEYFTKAAELGEVGAHFCLGSMCQRGIGVEKDEKRGIHHYEQAAIGGHPGARGLLADYEEDKGRLERAAKHLIIAANLGQDLALKPIKQLFVQGIVSKEEYAAALRGHQAAVDATKSAERDNEEACSKKHASRRS
jgi:TPR repeat protein